MGTVDFRASYSKGNIQDDILVEYVRLFVVRYFCNIFVGKRATSSKCIFGKVVLFQLAPSLLGRQILPKSRFVTNFILNMNPKRIVHFLLHLLMNNMVSSLLTSPYLNRFKQSGLREIRKTCKNRVKEGTRITCVTYAVSVTV